jgi:hypothetical protein
VFANVSAASRRALTQNWLGANLRICSRSSQLYPCRFTSRNNQRAVLSSRGVIIFNHRCCASRFALRGARE